MNLYKSPQFEPANSGQVRVETVDLYKKDVPT